MSFSYTSPIATDVHRVRALIPDTTPGAGNYHFEDEEIQVFLDQWSQDVLLATSQALETLAQNYAMRAVRYTINGFSMDRSVVSAQLRERAKELRLAARSVPFEFESVLDHYVDSSGRDRSGYVDSGSDSVA